MSAVIGPQEIVVVLSVTDGLVAVAGDIAIRNLAYPRVVISVSAAMVVASPGSTDRRATYRFPVAATQAEPFHVLATAPLEVSIQ
jgi:hypothetical protein